MHTPPSSSKASSLLAAVIEGLTTHLHRRLCIRRSSEMSLSCSQSVRRSQERPLSIREYRDFETLVIRIDMSQRSTSYLAGPRM